MSPGELIFTLMTSTFFYGAGGSCILKALESGSVTLEWKFSSEIALKPLNIICDQDPVTNQTSREFFHQMTDTEDARFQANHFRGRVQVERAGLRDGLLQVQISALRLDDSGLYSCIFYSSEGRSSSKCHLSVTTAPAETTPSGPPQGQAPAESARPGRQRPGGPGLYAALLSFLMIVLFLGVRFTFAAAPNSLPGPSSVSEA